MILPAVTGMAIVLLFSSPLFANQDAVKHVQINPASATRTDIFEGTGEFVELQFINESGNRDVKVFPEPPITVKDSRTGTRCTIEGGVWVRDSVFLCNGERVLVVQEFTGSNDFLNFHDTRSCAKLRSVDVSNVKWTFTGPVLVIKKSKVQKIPLKKLCRAKLP